MNSLEKWMILTPLQNLPNNVGDLGKIIVATSFEWLPKVQKNRQIWSLCCQSTILRCFSSTRRSFSIFCFVVIFIQKKNICSFYEDQAR